MEQAPRCGRGHSADEKKFKGNLTYCDLGKWVEEHGPNLPGSEPDHLAFVVGTEQVHLVCLDCGIDVTADAVDAGLPVRKGEHA